jgi:hypothetical protein
MNKATLPRLIGRSMVLVFILLTLSVGWGEALRPGGSSAWTMLPAVLLLAGLLLLPALMILGRHWGQLASVLSGFVSAALFFAAITRAPRLTDKLLNSSSEGHPWAPFLALMVLICAWVLPWKLHGYLRPRLHRLLEGNEGKPIKHPAAT